MSRVTLFADVLLPLPLKGVFTYRIPHVMNDQVKPGCRVLVPFGRSRKYAGLVRKVHDVVPDVKSLKYLESVIDKHPFVTQQQLAFWDWLSAYYLCTAGEVMQAALPHGSKEVADTEWHPKTEIFVRLSDQYDDEDKLKELLDHTERRAPRQMELLMAFIRLSGRYETASRPVLRHELAGSIKGGSQALLVMLKKGIFELVVREISRFPTIAPGNQDIDFNEDQLSTLEDIRKNFDDHDVVLLHGVTSSGKTEIYIKLIREYIEQGKQVLYLLPEIALTTQIINRLQNHFGSRAGIYHSRFDQMERTEVWKNLLDEGTDHDGQNRPYDLVLGPRSAVFLPFSRLGLVIVDEEHDQSFKQFDPAPRYHARDAAIYLATLFGAKVLLGSATPSVESYYNAQTGKYGFAQLMKRHGGMMMPEILIADIRKETFSKKMKSHFSALLFNLMTAALEMKEQVILFQNRRGFSLRLQCDLCDWAPKCHQCDVMLVYHKKEHRLKCHYCGFSSSLPAKCPSCDSTSIKMRGFGTEKIEDELPVFFPGASIKRMDLDTTRSKNAYRDIINDFENRKIDILIGTQMVSKGLDFDHVSLVGIMNADNMLGFPDFRAHERAYQLMAQVSGRSGRRGKRGKVVIQTYNPQHPVIRHVIANDYLSMYVDQITERRRFKYPPFVRLVQLTVMHRNEETLNDAASDLAAKLKRSFPAKVFGPEYPLVSRVRNMYLKQILVKLDRNQQLPLAKEKILAIIDYFREANVYKQLKVAINVDPA